MEPAAAQTGHGPSRSVWDRFLDWLFQQGPATMILTLILGLVWQFSERVVPMIIDRVEARLEYINDSHEKRLTMVLDQHAADRAMFQREQERLQHINTALLNKIHGPADLRP